jgi:hypothetical protein
MIKDRKNAEKDALQESLNDFKDSIDEKKKALKDYADEQKDNLQRELDGYEEIINAEKRLIDQRQEAAKYEDEVANKNKEISDIDAELLAMQFDTSEEARARRLQLEADRVDKTKELSDIQNEYSVNNQKDALDQELSDFEKKIKNEQDAIDKNLKYQTDALDAQYKAYEKNIKDQIKLIDEYLRSTGQITADAIALMKGASQQFYNDLIAWNKIYGTSVDNDITAKWTKALGALRRYNSEAAKVRDPINKDYRIGGPIDLNSEVPEYHNGGVVGAAGSNSEIFAKLLSDETITTPNQIASFFKNTIPAIAGMGGDNINISMPISVGGNLDKSVLPAMKEMILSTVNEAMKNRGQKRNAFSFSV